MKEILIRLWGTEFNSYEEGLTVEEVQVHGVLSFLASKRPWVDPQLGQRVSKFLVNRIC
jgi:hypothetical protein